MPHFNYDINEYFPGHGDEELFWEVLTDGFNQIKSGVLFSSTLETPSSLHPRRLFSDQMALSISHTRFTQR